jgi:excisionase family DNA binding protein
LLRNVLRGTEQGAVVRVSTADGASVEAAIPRRALDVVERSLEAAAEGGVAIIGAGDDYTPQEAARILGVSRSFLTRQMDAARLPFHMVGSHRRIRPGDLLAFKRRLDSSNAAMGQLVNNVDGLPDGA